MRVREREREKRTRSNNDINILMTPRRRPKGLLTTCQSATILAAMAKHVITAQQKDPNEIMMMTLLSDECTQYLQSIDAADKFSNAPNAIDQNAWNHLCRMRRSKIEMEFKVTDTRESFGFEEKKKF